MAGASPDQAPSGGKEGGKGASPARAPVRREPKVDVAPPALTEGGRALYSLVGEMLAGQVDTGVEVDEVSIRTSPDDIAKLSHRLKSEPELWFDYLRSLSVVDYGERLEVNYHLFSYRHRHKLVVKVNLDPESPALPSVAGIWRSAEWYERECRDLFGVDFVGHPDPAPLLLYEGFEGYPGRKSFPLHEYAEW